MRIAIVLNTSWNIYNFRKGLILSLLNEGHQVVAIAPRDKFSAYLEEMGCEFYPVQLENKGSNPLSDIGYMRQLYTAYKKTQPDVILQFTIKPNIYGTLAAYPLGKLVINNVCGLGTVFLRENMTSRVAKLLYKLSFRFPKRVFFQNEDDLQLFLDKKLIKEKLTDLVPGSGIPVDQFKPRDFKRNETFTFLMIARLLYDKGIIEYINAIKLLKAKNIKAKFQLLGSIEDNKKLGISKEQLNDWIEQGLVEYLGTTEHVADVIADADCVVLPSYREGTPRSLLEAAGMAKPLIATNIAGCRQTIDHGVNGYLCSLKDHEDLAVKMQKMYDLSEEQLHQMGKASRKKAVNEFDERLVIQKYLKIIRSYEKVLNRKTKKNITQANLQPEYV